MAKARQQYFADETSIEKDSREFAIEASVLEKINSIEPGAQVNVIETVKVNGTALEPDAEKAVDVSVPLVDDTLYSTSSVDALSAKQGRVLYDYIQNISSRGRYLSNWNCVTGLATTNPADNPYNYRSGDYYLVGTVAVSGGTNYRPNGSQYVINQASTTIESETVKAGDMYIYDGTAWTLLVNTEREIAVDSALSLSSTNPVENRVVTGALNGKQATLTAGANISIDANNEISAVDTTYESKTAASGGTDVSLVTTGEKYTWNEKQDALVAGNNISIAADGKTISAVDTTYASLPAASGGTNVSLVTTGEKYTWGEKQDALVAGTNIQIASDGKTISATDTTYSAGSNVSINANNEISADVNTKIFHITNTTGQANLEIAQEAYDWLLAGGYPIIEWNSKAYLYDNLYNAGPDIIFVNQNPSFTTNSNDRTVISYMAIRFTVSGTSVTEMTYTNLTKGGFLNTQAIYSSSFTPTENGHPATKKYADDRVSDDAYAAGWDGVTGVAPSKNAVYDKISAMDTTISGKQATLTAGANIQIAADGVTISATDTTYTAGTNISIDANNEISATDTTYSAGANISISNNNVISATDSSAIWGNISGTLADQTDLGTALSGKQNTLTAGTGIDITSDTISIDSTVAKASDLNTKTFYLSNSSDLTTAQAAYDWYVAGKNPIIAYNNSTYCLGQLSTGFLYFFKVDVKNTDYTTSSNIVRPSIRFAFSSDVVSSISIFDSTIAAYLSTTVDYSTPYTPQYNGSPATKKYVDDGDTYIGTSAPSNPTEGRLWYDTTNDVLKTYDGTNWNIAGGSTYTAGTGIDITNDTISVDSTVAKASDLNTKTFYLSSTSDLTTAQAALDWYLAGKNPILMLDGLAYSLSHYYSPTDTLGFIAEEGFYRDDGHNYISLSYSNNTVTSVAKQVSKVSNNFLSKYNTTSYTPTADYHPATKKYVDDGDTYIGGSEPTSNLVEGRLWYDTTNDVLKSYNGTSWDEAGTHMVVLSYGSSTWQDFLDAYNKNAIVYCRASSNTNPGTGNQTRMAFMAFVDINSSTQAIQGVEFQYYRSRSDHNSAANQLDEVYVYKLVPASGGTWTVTQRNTGAKAVAGTGISLGWGSGNMTISADAQYDNTAYASSWDGVTNKAPTQNAVYDKISAMDTTISGKQDTLTAGTGIDITSNTISVDSTIATKSDLANFAGFQVVATLPTTDIKTNIIYLLGPVGSGADKYEEYIYSNSTWIMIGDTSIDLSPYFHKTNDDSDDIIEGVTHLFLTSAERTILGNTSNTNSGDETKTTIQTKLGAASSSSDGYLTSTDWSTFNGKANASDLNTKTFYLSGTGSSATVLAEAQAAYDWYLAGKNPIVVYNKESYFIKSVNSARAELYTVVDGKTDYSASGYSSLNNRGVTFDLSSNVVTNVATPTSGYVKVLATDVNYGTPYTPLYNGSPATKKYVDDNVGVHVVTISSLSSSSDGANVLTAINNYGFENVIVSYSYTDQSGDLLVTRNYYPLIKNSDTETGNQGFVFRIVEGLTIYKYTVVNLGAGLNPGVYTEETNLVSDSELNTKTFYLTGTTGTTNIATAQAVLDWYLAGKNPIIIYENIAYLVKSFSDTTPGSLSFYGKNLKTWFPSGGVSYISEKALTISFDSQTSHTVTSISASNDTIGTYLEAGASYTGSYTPQYDGSPATKKYVDDKKSTITITLTSAGWSSNAQTVTATGVTANNSVIVSPAPSSITDYTDAKIYCSAQASNSLTFTCDTAPSNDITVNVVILN